MLTKAKDSEYNSVVIKLIQIKDNIYSLHMVYNSITYGSYVVDFASRPRQSKYEMKVDLPIGSATWEAFMLKTSIKHIKKTLNIFIHEIYKKE